MQKIKERDKEDYQQTLEPVLELDSVCHSSLKLWIDWLWKEEMVEETLTEVLKITFSAIFKF